MSETPPPGSFDPDGIDPAIIQAIVSGGIPHYGVLGVEFVTASREAATLRLPYRADFVGDPETGTLHGGVITTLIDSVCGIAVFMAMGRVLPIATLDLRIDYLKPATAGQDVLATAECYKVTRSIAFLRARAYHQDRPDDLIATCASTFMLGSSGEVPLPKHIKVPQ